ncbi:sulfatase-like hydrolase/transferase [Sunxiuqinia sp. A32]|uniref:sulfatase-like hydrolase/transferase n=1 Tax=Sunxiuqinia sp. A32 TaxID=3461496 RepID=UPI004046535D
MEILRQETIKYVACLIFVATSVLYGFVGQAQDKVTPNVILILADDMGLGDLSSLNNGLSKTPNLDQLKSDGVWFSQAYTSAPVCAPARASMLTGLYPHRTGCVTLNLKRFPELTRIKEGLVTVADVFNMNGYATGLVGKWHCGIGDGYGPLDRGFDEFEGYHGFNLKTYFDYEFIVQDSVFQVTDNYLTDDISERAIKFVRKHRDEPFFLHIAHSAPHLPLSAPQNKIDYYKAKGFDTNTATVYAMIEIMDRGIGELMSELKHLGLDRKTVVIFSSDNGPAPMSTERFNLDLKGKKYTVYEGGLHVPFIVRWAGAIEAHTCNETIQFTDIFPSLVELCELEIPSKLDLDGGSFIPYLFREAGEMPEYRFWQWNRGVPEYSHNAAVRFGDWKLVYPYVSNGIIFSASDSLPAMYNLKDDPFEQYDLSQKHQRLYEDLFVRLNQWAKEVEYDRIKD